MKASFFKDEWTTYSPADMMIDISWKELASILTTFTKVSSKEQTQMFNLWEFKIENDQIHRCKDDCIALHGLVLDYDNNLLLNDALMQFNGFECVIYTTFNHSSIKDKFRIVLPFNRPMTMDQFVLKRQAMIDAFPGADRASFSRSQAIFLHSGPDETKSFACKMDGIFLDPDIFIDEIVEPVVYKERIQNTEIDSEFKQAYKTAIIKSLMSCKGIRHLNSLSVVIMLKSCDATFSDFQQIAKVAGAPDSCIQTIKSQTESWTAISDSALITKAKRDKFIANFGGTPISFKKKIVTATATELKQEVIRKWGTGK